MSEEQVYLLQIYFDHCYKNVCITEDKRQRRKTKTLFIQPELLYRPSFIATIYASVFERQAWKDPAKD